MTQESKAQVKSVILKQTTYSRLNKLRLEFAYMNDDSKSFDETVDYLLNFLEHTIKKNENEETME